MPEYFYHYGEKVTIESVVDIKGVTYAICELGDDYPEYRLIKKAELQKWEDTYQFKEQQKVKDQMEDIKKRKAELVESIKSEVLQSLVSRLKINAAFAKDSKMSFAGLAIARELEGILKDKEVK